MKFRVIKDAVNQQFTKMQEERFLYKTNVSKDVLWEVYLKSFPSGTNEIYKERTEHDCQCCKQFIRAAGNVVAIIDNKLVSIWDIKIGGHYQVVADALSKLVKSNVIKDQFLHFEKNAGTDYNRVLVNDITIKWEHFHCVLAAKFVPRKSDEIGTKLSHFRAGHDVLKRGLDELTADSTEIVLELIDSGSLYRGDEHRESVMNFLKLKAEYDKVKTKTKKDNFCWANLNKPAARIRNTAIGTLLVDLSEGLGLTKSVKRFENKVAPTNYKRPKALVTKGMIAKAQKTVEELGVEDSLSRRYAVGEDLTINNVLFADRETKQAMNVFEEMSNEIKVDKKSLGKVEEIHIDSFINAILPKVSTVSLLFENKYINNLVSLISPQDKEAKNIFKWDNNFSWSYNGEMTDSIKERVKKAGGNVNGVIRVSLSWFNKDDLDIHVKEPNGNEIYYINAQLHHTSSGILDVDMNVTSPVNNAVENIVWTQKHQIPEGLFKVWIHNYTPRETTNKGFVVELEYDGVIQTFTYDQQVSGNVGVIEFEFSQKYGIKIVKSLPSTESVKEVWGINSQKFHEVSMIMNSPNHWDGNQTGNKHYFFMLKDCKNSGTTRGFYNEFLNEDLQSNRKVFEVLGSKLKVEPSDNQLSGLGFSSTQRNEVFCNVTGHYNRTIKLIF